MVLFYYFLFVLNRQKSVLAQKETKKPRKNEASARNARFELDHNEYIDLKKQTHDSVRQAFNETLQDMKAQVKQAAAEVAGELEQGQKKN